MTPRPTRAELREHSGVEYPVSVPRACALLGGDDAKIRAWAQHNRARGGPQGADCARHLLRMNGARLESTGEVKMFRLPTHHAIPVGTRLPVLPVRRVAVHRAWLVLHRLRFGMPA